jgi:hypothetical protein
VYITGLTIVVLHHVTVTAMQYTWLAKTQRRSMFTGLVTASTCFYPDQLNFRFFNEGL